MKKIISGLGLLFLGVSAVAQNGLENIVVEKYYISDANDASVNGIGGVLPVGSVTYRIYVDMLPGYRFQAVYGIPGHELRIETSTLFFNNEDRGATTPTYTKTQAADNTVMLDSWLSVGGACVGNYGILKASDNGVATVVNNESPQVLQSTNPLAGIPVKDEDGLITGTPEEVTTLGINSEINVFGAQNDGTNGPLFSTSNGSWASLNGSTGPNGSNMVLIAQITTDGCFSFELNIQVGTPLGGVQNYVARNPILNEIQLPSLIYEANCSVNLNMNLFLQGYYSSPGSSTPMDNAGSGGCFYIDGGIDGFPANPNDVDSIFVSLVDSAIYANTFDVAASTFETKSGILQTDGSLLVLFSGAASDNSYFLKVEQRNHVETWSAETQLMNAITAYNFTDDWSKAYEYPGNPFHAMYEMEPGKWAIYVGDVYRDGVVDFQDIPELTTQIELPFPYGYLSADLNGNGFIDFEDIPYLTSNIEYSGGVYSQHP